MIIARWQFMSRFGSVDDCIAVLRKWEIDVGDRVGWKASSVRILRGFAGVNDSQLELETRCDSLADFESAWGDIERNPHHREYMKQLEHLMVPGSSRWSFLREAPIFTE